VLFYKILKYILINNASFAFLAAWHHNNKNRETSNKCKIEKSIENEMVKRHNKNREIIKEHTK